MWQWLVAHPPVAILAIFLLFALVEALRGQFRSASETPEDAPLETAITLLFAAVIYPAILLLVGWLARTYTPSLAGVLADQPWWVLLCLLVVCDDLTQYAWHRLSHTPLLWPLHRAHHSAPYMGIRVVYRNNFFYYAMMPGLWLSSYLVFLGAGAVYVPYLLVKMLVIFGAHSELRWDSVLYRHRITRPLAWILERTISTPATHFAHHAITQDDGIGHYKGNYGNLLFVWDLLFGTALITRKYPPRFGLSDDLQHGAERWYVQLLYPLLKSRRAASALAADQGSLQQVRSGDSP